MARARQLLFGGLVALLTTAAAKLQKREALPSFAITYAPYSFLYTGESYWPSDLTTHLENVIPEYNFSPLADVGSVTLDTLDNYNSSVYLTGANNAISDPPSWATSDYGKPDSTGYSTAPALIIAVELNSTTTDVYYHLFYSYNYGGMSVKLTTTAPTSSFD
jgi:hypothetical protein